jgi:spore photoproduct lyase
MLVKIDFWPARVFFEPDVLNYPRGRKLFQLFEKRGVPLRMTASHNRVQADLGTNERTAFEEAKRTLVIGVRRGLKFQPCKPSAHYQLPLATGCPGLCRYCYLQTTLGKKPYLRAYINVEEILKRASEYIRQREPAETVFEGAAVSDPLFIDPFTGGVSEAIRFFGEEKQGRFRLVSKFTGVEPFLKLPHRGQTHFRFSINAPEVIRRWEKRTPSLEKRLAAALKIIEAGYRFGFLLAPLFLEDEWQKRYRALLEQLADILPKKMPPFTFELITHRFTSRARRQIEALYPGSGLNMDPEQRQFRYGQFGYGKYLYPPPLRQEAEEFFKREIKSIFPTSTIEYFI